MEIIKDVEQGSDEWFVLRCGVVTASKFKDVMAKGQGKTRQAYMRFLAAEIITGEPQKTYSNDAMTWGTETEPQARSAYELFECVDVEQVAFIKHTLKAGASPDGLVGNDGLVEFKCPETTTQIETYLRGSMPTYHKPQVQGQLWISGREWCDFVSFDPRINGHSHYFKERIYRDEKYISNLAGEVTEFINELNEMVEKLI